MSALAEATVFDVEPLVVPDRPLALSSRRSIPSLANGSTALGSVGATHDDAVARLHALLLHAARFEVGAPRRRHSLPAR